MRSPAGESVLYREIPFELPRFGGFFSGENYIFAVFGQNNMDERSDVEVYRFVRYDKEWNRIDDLWLYGGVYGEWGYRCYGNVSEPFSAGGPRFAEHGDLLVMHTGRTMYRGRYLPDGGGARHQRYLYVFIDIPTMEFLPYYSA